MVQNQDRRPGDPGRREVNRGAAAANRKEECRKRNGEELERVGDERLGRETAGVSSTWRRKRARRRRQKGAAKETLRRARLRQVFRRYLLEKRCAVEDEAAGLPGSWMTAAGRSPLIN